MFSRIQNLHISQTDCWVMAETISLVEFKIYISLKLRAKLSRVEHSLVEFKIYISLKLYVQVILNSHCLVEFKIYISLKQIVE